jgi:hypothetical protein
MIKITVAEISIQKYYMLDFTFVKLKSTTSYLADYHGRHWGICADEVEGRGLDYYVRDTNDYHLISTGFGHAAVAVNYAAKYIDPSAPLFPGHSSEMKFVDHRAHGPRRDPLC